MKIACVMPTRNRAEFLDESIGCFLGQDFPGDLSLVILDDSDSEKAYITVPSNACRPRNREIHYRRIAPMRFRTGAKRNEINSMAHDWDVIVHWDDDDWYHPSRVRNQISFLLSSRAPVVGYHSILYWSRANASAYQYNDPTFRPHAAGSSLCYYRDEWLYFNKFDDRQVAEDFLFCVRARNAGKLASQDGGQMLVARNHGANTCNPSFGTKKYPQVPTSELPLGFVEAERRLTNRTFKPIL